MGEQVADPFVPPVIDAVKRHMNDDHAADSLLICQVLGDQPLATHATMSDMDAAGISFTVQVGDQEAAVRIPWSEPVTERTQVRAEVVRMCERALELSGRNPINPGTHGE